MQTEIKKVWRKPEVKTITAGSAENGGGCGNDGNGKGCGGDDVDRSGPGS